MVSPVWKTFDQAALDAQYTTRSQIGAGYDAWNAARRNGSDEARRTLNPTLDIPYGAGARQRLDVFPAPDDVTSPATAVFFHGGFWKSGDKGDLSLVACGLRSLGAAVVLPNYPLCPIGSIGDAVASALGAVAWVTDHAQDFGANPRSIWLCGHSSGAHLVASCCARLAQNPGRLADAVRGSIVTSGMYELEPIRRSYLNQDARLSERDVIDLSPARAGSFLRIPVIIAVGDQESSEFIQQSENLAAAIGLLGAAASFARVPLTNHYTMLEQWRPGSDLLTRFQSLLAA